MAYVTYPVSGTNAYPSHAGLGLTREESVEKATVWASQVVRTVPFSRAPGWAKDEAVEALLTPCLACGKSHPVDQQGEPCVDEEGNPLDKTRNWGVIHLRGRGLLVEQTPEAQRTIDGYILAGYPV